MGVASELAEFLSVAMANLNEPVACEHRNEIAQKIGKDWETLATFIGMPPQEVYDLKETYLDNPLTKRLGMMTRWKELYGSKATYMKLIKGLEQIGRRDLTEFLVKKLESKSVCAKNDRPPGRPSPGKEKLNKGIDWRRCRNYSSSYL